MADLLTSPLHDRHVALGAKFGEFGGWSMPLEYTGVVAEHTAVRTAVGLFDVSHLGKADVIGSGAAAYVNSVLTNDLTRIGPGQAQYTLICDDATGGVIDDLIQYYRSDDDIFLIPNAGNTTEVVRRLAEGAPDGVTVTNRHRDYVVLAVQGPKSPEVLEALGFPIDHDYMAFAVAPYAGEDVIVCRTGYSGERGFELVAPNAVAGQLWDAILEAGAGHGILPIGLGARDTLRTEMGYPLHGQDISPTINPLEGGAGWAVSFKKPSFWGREVLLKVKEAGPARTLRAIKQVDRAIPRGHMAVLHNGEVVGEVTSGTFSPTLKQGIGLALIASSVPADAEVTLDVRGKQATFAQVKAPFVESHVR